MSTPARAARTLGLAVFIALILLLGVHTLTKQRIEDAQQDWLLQNLAELFPTGQSFDNDPLESMHQLVAPELGTDKPVAVYPLYQSGKPVACVLELVAPDGYSGDIQILLGVRYDGQVIAARVIEHKETPGLGDDIEYRKSDWIIQFNGQSLVSNQQAGWNLRSAGGDYDGLTGATITSRAVIQAIYRALDWYKNHKDEVYL